MNAKPEQRAELEPMKGALACPGHIASDADLKICRHCGTHVNEERPDADD